MAVQLLQVAAIQMDDAAAVLTPQQKAAAVRRVGTVLVKGPFLRGDPVNAARLLQLFQLAVNGGKAHRAARLAQFLRDLVGGEGLPRALFQTLKDCLTLFCRIRHVSQPFNMKMKLIFIS
jgi:hypothetical protein